MARLRVFDAAGVCIADDPLDTPFRIGSGDECELVVPGLAPIHAWFVRDHGLVAYYEATRPEPVEADDDDVTAPAREAVPHSFVQGPGTPFTFGTYRVDVYDLPDNRPYVPGDSTETELVAALRANLLDDAVREVYADWLEQNGFSLRAQLLRAETEAAIPGIDLSIRLERLAPRGDEPFRALVSRAPLDRCDGLQFRFRCPKTWNALAPTADDRVRHCATCEREVHYCTSIHEARAHGEQQHCIAIDAAVARGEALEAYDDNMQDTWLGDISPEPELAWGPGRCGPDVED
jgi:uncharacterized protein (TIGR02996 family)